MTTSEITRREALRRAAWLLGGTLSAPTVLGVLAGCDRSESDVTTSRRTAAGAPWAPRTLTAGQSALILAIAEAIIPETNTPGARAARVNEFIDTVLTDYYPAEERARFLAGLASVDERAQDAHRKRFVDLTPAQQTDIVAELDRLEFAKTMADRSDTARAEEAPVTREGDVAAGRGAGDSPRTAAAAPADASDDRQQSFFRMMKELTLVGYYTSEVGATQELRAMPLVGPYLADVPYAAGTPAWS